MPRQQLTEAVDTYVRFRETNNYSRNTVKMDRQVLTRFLATAGNIYCHSISGQHVTAYFEAVAPTRGAASQSLDHTVLKGFFAWCRGTKRMAVDQDPMFGRRRPQPMTVERYRVPVHEFGRLLDLAEERTPRDRMLCAMILYTFMRDSEVTSLRIGDIDLDGGWILATIHKSKLQDRVPICSELDSELRAWLTHYTEVVGYLDPGYFLIPSRWGSPIFEPGSNKIIGHESRYKPTKALAGAGARVVNPILSKMGVSLTDSQGKSKKEGAHTLRRSGARAFFDELVENGYDHGLRIVQSMLHHASIKDTERYIGITADRRSRDEIVRGRTMYARAGENVVPLHGVEGGTRNG